MKISGILHLPEGKNPPCVIASHGLLSSKDSEKYIALGERISQRGDGHASLRFQGNRGERREGRRQYGQQKDCMIWVQRLIL